MKHVLAVLFLAVPLMAQFGGARRVTPQGATLPAKCSTGDLFQKTGASAGLYNCSAPDTWVAAFGSGGASLPSQAGNSGKYLTTDGTTPSWAAVLSAPYALDITNGTTVNLDHNYGTKDAKAVCVAAASPYKETAPGETEYPSTNRITLTFSPAFTGRCAVISSVAGSGGGGGSGTVTSVGLTLPSEFTVTGSPVTGSGALAGAWASQTQAKVFAAPATSTGTPTFRALVATDLPTHNAATATALAATPTKCSAGNYPLGVDAQGNAQNCTAAGSGGGGGAVYPIVFAGETTLTVTAATHGLGTTPVPAGGCRRTSDGKWPDGWEMTTNSSGDITIVPAAGAAFTGTCYVAGTAGGNLVLTDPALVPTRITGSASLSFSTFGGTGNCEEQNVTVAGAAAGDVPTTSLYNTLPAGIILGAVYVSTTNTVTIRLCRLAGTNTISSQTFNTQIVRGM